MCHLRLWHNVFVADYGFEPLSEAIRRSHRCQAAKRWRKKLVGGGLASVNPSSGDGGYMSQRAIYQNSFFEMDKSWLIFLGGEL